MFLPKILSRNEKLIDAAVTLHQEGLIPSNSYLLDIDTITENAKHMVDLCREYKLKFYPMTKQIGRNAFVIRLLSDLGADGCVCVDMADARRVHEQGVKVGHLGHLVQVPAGEIDAAVAMKPEYWTVFSMDKAQAISQAVPAGEKQKILLRIHASGDTFYPGHEGGFDADRIVEWAKAINELPGLQFAGLTTFPTQLFSAEQKAVVHTANYWTLFEAKEKLEANGFTDIEINAPGTTSSHLFEEMGTSGVTQVEPGHGLTGTTPLHAYKDLVERPAMAYVSEVSHFYQGHPYCFGGGLYIDPVFDPYPVKACVGRTPETAKNNLVVCDMPAPEAIDYYGILDKDSKAAIRVGDTVVFGFRAQAFVTRAFVVPVSGISKGQAFVEGIYDSDGKPTVWK